MSFSTDVTPVPVAILTQIFFFESGRVFCDFNQYDETIITF